MICGGDGRVHGRTWQSGRRAWSGNAPPPPHHPLHVPIHILVCLLRSPSLSSSRHHLPRRHVHIHKHHHHIRSPPLRHPTCPHSPPYHRIILIFPHVHVLSGPVDVRIRHPFHPTSCTLRIPARLPLHAFTPLSVIPPCPVLNTVSSLISASSFLLALSALLFTVLMIFGRKSW